MGDSGVGCTETERRIVYPNQHFKSLSSACTLDHFSVPHTTGRSLGRISVVTNTVKAVCHSHLGVGVKFGWG